MSVIYLDLNTNGIWHRCHDDEWRSYYLRDGKCKYETCRVEIPYILLLGSTNRYPNNKNLFYTDTPAHCVSLSALTSSHKLELIDETIFYAKY